MKYEVTVEDPREIRRISDELFEIAEKNEIPELYAGLRHNHSSIVRGQKEDFRGLNIFDFGVQHPVEVRRLDGGDSWVHSPESRCYEKIQEIDRIDSKSLDKLMRQWGREGVELINGFLEENTDIMPLYQAGDIYDKNTGNQIAGLSAQIKDNYALTRMCFYETKNHEKAFHELINTDRHLAQKQENNEIPDPRNSITPLPGLYKYLAHDMEELEIEYDSLEIGEASENAINPKYCVTNRP